MIVIYPNGTPEAGKKYKFIKKMITPEELENYKKEKDQNQLVEPLKDPVSETQKSLNIKPSNRVSILELWRRSPNQGSIYKDIPVKEDYDPVAHAADITDTVGQTIRGGVSSIWKKIKNLGKTKEQIEKEAFDKKEAEDLNNVYNNSNY